MSSPSEDESLIAEPENPLFRRWAEWVLAHRALVLGLDMLATALLVWCITGLRVDMSSDPFLPLNSPTKLLNEQFQDDFGADTYSMLLVEGDVFSMTYLNRLRALHQDVQELDVNIPSLGHRDWDVATQSPIESPTAQPEATDDFAEFDEGGGEWTGESGGSIFIEVSSLINARQTVGSENGVRVKGLLDDWPSASDLPALKRHTLSDKTVVGRLVGAEAGHSLILARTDFMHNTDDPILVDALTELANRHTQPGFRVLVGGVPALFATLGRISVSDTSKLFLAALVIMMLVLAFVFRSPLGVVGPCAAVTLSAIWCLGFSGLMGRPLTQLTAVIPAFLICVGVGDAIHIQSAYRDKLGAGMPRREAAIGAIAATGLPVLLTSLTTAVGLLSFLLVDSPALVDMGLVGSAGVMAAMAQCLILLPIFLSWNRQGDFGSRKARESGALDKLLDFCNQISRTPARAWAVLATFAVLSLVAWRSAQDIYVSHDDSQVLNADLPAREVFDKVNKFIGGGSSVSLYIRTAEGKSIADQKLMAGLAKLETHIIAYRDPKTGEAVITNVGGVLDVLRETNRALHEGDEKHYRVPDEQRAVVDLFTVFESSAPDELKRLATVDLRHGAMFVRTQWMDAKRFEPLVAHIERGVQRYVGDRATVEVTGSAMLWVEVTGSTIHNVIRSFSIAFGLITLFMVFLMRSFKLGAISMVPNLLPIVGLVGVMGATGIWLDYSNALISSIALGIVVDDTIHFLHHFRVHLDKHHSVDRALSHAYAYSGRAMIITSVVLVGGFSAFVLGALATARNFGKLLAVTVALALLVDLVLTPALLRVVYRKGLPKASVNKETRSASDELPSTSHSAELLEESA